MASEYRQRLIVITMEPDLGSWRLEVWRFLTTTVAVLSPCPHVHTWQVPSSLRWQVLSTPTVHYCRQLKPRPRQTWEPNVSAAAVRYLGSQELGSRPHDTHTRFGQTVATPSIYVHNPKDSHVHFSSSQRWNHPRKLAFYYNESNGNSNKSAMKRVGMIPVLLDSSL